MFSHPYLGWVEWCMPNFQCSPKVYVQSAGRKTSQSFWNSSYQPVGHDLYRAGIPDILRIRYWLTFGRLRTTTPEPAHTHKCPSLGTKAHLMSLEQLWFNLKSGETNWKRPPKTDHPCAKPHGSRSFMPLKANRTPELRAMHLRLASLENQGKLVAGEGTQWARALATRAWEPEFGCPAPS